MSTHIFKEVGRVGVTELADDPSRLLNALLVLADALHDVAQAAHAIALHANQQRRRRLALPRVVQRKALVVGKEAQQRPQLLRHGRIGLHQAEGGQDDGVQQVEGVVAVRLRVGAAHQAPVEAQQLGHQQRAAEEVGAEGEHRGQHFRLEGLVGVHLAGHAGQQWPVQREGLQAGGKAGRQLRAAPVERVNLVADQLAEGRPDGRVGDGAVLGQAAHDVRGVAPVAVAQQRQHQTQLLVGTDRLRPLLLEDVNVLVLRPLDGHDLRELAVKLLRLFNLRLVGLDDLCVGWQELVLLLLLLELEIKQKVSSVVITKIVFLSQHLRMGKCRRRE